MNRCRTFNFIICSFLFFYVAILTATHLTHNRFTHSCKKRITGDKKQSLNTRTLLKDTPVCFQPLTPPGRTYLHTCHIWSGWKKSLLGTSLKGETKIKDDDNVLWCLRFLWSNYIARQVTTGN